MSSSSRSVSFVPLVALVLLGAKCGGDSGSTSKDVSSSGSVDPKSTQAPDACSVLTPAEIEAVTGAKSVAPKADAHGSVGTCNFHAGEELMPVVSIVLAPGMPKVSSSAEMAAWRSKQGTSFGDVKIIIEPVEGLGVPAIRNEVEGMGLVTVEASVGGKLLDVTTSSLERSKALVTKAMPRLK
jgi:hypothetical protein